MTSIKRNIMANAVGRFWAICSIFMFVPLYIKYLGIESYGLIGFYAVLQSVLLIADAGLTATLNRELARLSALRDRVKEMRDLVRTIEIFYWGIAIACGLAIQFLPEPFVERWVKVGNLPREMVFRAVRLAGWAIAMQFPATLYQGGLLGLQRQMLSNTLQVGWSLMRNGAVVLVLIFLSPTLEAFFIWNLLCNLTYSFLAGSFLWRSMGATALQEPAEILLSRLKGVWKYAAGMAGMTVLSAIFMQLDKVVVMRMLTLKMFAYYTLATMVSQMPVLIAGPIAVAVFPRMTVLVTKGDFDNLAVLYHRSCQIVSSLAIPIGVTIALFSYPLLLAWSRSAEVAQNASGITTWYVIGSLSLAMQIIPYQLALANGYVRLNLKISIASLVIIVPLLILLVRSHGAVGGAMAWTTLNLMVLFPYVYMLHKRFLPGATVKWYRQDIGVPLGISLFFGIVARFSTPAGGSSVLVTLAIAATGATLSMVGSAMASPGIAEAVFGRLRPRVIQ